MWPHRSMIDAGIIAPGHSDCPVCHPNPMRGIHAMVNRRTASGADLYQGEAVTVYEAIQAYTVLGAYVGREEHLKGQLTIGKLADFTILEDDIFAIPTDRIDQVRVAETYVGGRQVYARA